MEEIKIAKLEIRRGKSKLKIGKDPRSSYIGKYVCIIVDKESGEIDEINRTIN